MPIPTHQYLVDKLSKSQPKNPFANRDKSYEIAQTVFGARRLLMTDSIALSQEHLFEDGGCNDSLMYLADNVESEIACEEDDYSLICGMTNFINENFDLSSSSYVKCIGVLFAKNCGEKFERLMAIAGRYNISGYDGYPLNNNSFNRAKSACCFVRKIELLEELRRYLQATMRYCDCAVDHIDCQIEQSLLSENLIQICDKYQDLYWVENLQWNDRLAIEVDPALPLDTQLLALRKKYRRSVNSKLNICKKLPVDCFDQLYEKFSDHVRWGPIFGLLVLFGMRCSEIEKGIRLQAVSGSLVVTIQTSKLYEGRGYSRFRVLTVAPECNWSRLLFNLASTSKNKTVKIFEKAGAISDKVPKVFVLCGNGERLYLSAIIFRHLFIAYLKGIWSAPAVAAAAGHLSSFTQRYYAPKRFGKLRTGVGGVKLLYAQQPDPLALKNFVCNEGWKKIREHQSRRNERKVRTVCLKPEMLQSELDEFPQRFKP